MTEPDRDVIFPLVPALNATALTACLMALCWPVGLAFAMLVSAVYIASRCLLGRARVHAWLNKASEEPSGC